MSRFEQRPYHTPIRTEREMLVDSYVANAYAAIMVAVTKGNHHCTLYPLLKKTAADAPIIRTVARYFLSAAYDVRISTWPETGYVSLHISW